MKPTRFFFLVATFFVVAQMHAQIRFDRGFTATSGVIFTLLDAYTDANGNSYLYWIDNDNYREEFIAKVDSSGNVMWRDTIHFPGYVESIGGSYASMSVVGNRILISTIVFPQVGGYPSIGIASIDTSGNQLQQTLIPVHSWTAGSWKIYQNAAAESWVIYTNGDQFVANDSLFVRKMDSNFNPLWEKSYTMTHMATYVNGTLDNSDNFYFSYSEDSITPSGHHLIARTRKLDANGNLQWLQSHAMCNYRNMMISGNQLIAAANVYDSTYTSSSNTGDVLITFFDTLNGNENFNDVVNGTMGEQDRTGGISADLAGNIYLTGTQNINSSSSSPHYSTFVKKYSASGTVLWLNTYSISPIYFSSAFGVRHSASGDTWIYNVYSQTNWSASEFYLWRLTPTGTIDSTLYYSIAPLFYGNGVALKDNFNGLYVAYQQVQCGGNRVGVIRFGAQENIENVAENEVSNSGNIFPNPANENCFISFSDNEAGKATVQIFDLSGQLISSEDNYTVQPGENSIEVNTSFLAAGTYMVAVVQDGKRIVTTRLVKM